MQRLAGVLLIIAIAIGSSFVSAPTPVHAACPSGEAYAYTIVSSGVYIEAELLTNYSALGSGTPALYRMTGPSGSSNDDVVGSSDSDSTIYALSDANTYRYWWRYRVSATDAGSYKIWVRGVGPDGDSDSFWVGPGTPVSVSVPTSGLGWTLVGTYTLNQATYDAIWLKLRETGALLDRIAILPTNVTPSGVGGDMIFETCGPIV